MKVVILAGGRGARVADEEGLQVKPLIEVGGRPLIWHVMKIYAAHGFNEFVVCLGQKGWQVKEYFANYALYQSDVTVDLTTGETRVHQNRSEPWRITLVDTGEDTSTGGRLVRARSHLDNGDFCVSYCDTLADVDVTALLDLHRRSSRFATVTAVQPSGRLGSLAIGKAGEAVPAERPSGEGAWVNGGFFVLSPAALDHIDGDEPWEQRPMQRLSRKGQLGAFTHRGFWRSLDTQRDKLELDALWQTGAPWKTW